MIYKGWKGILVQKTNCTLHGDLYLSLERLNYFNLYKIIFQHDIVPIYKAKII